MQNIDNDIKIHGRIVRDLSTETGASGTVYLKFTVAVDRRGKNDADKTDFFECLAFGESAKSIERYFYKGKPIRIGGRMECDPYTAKDGTKRYPWTLKVDAWGFDINDPRQSGNDTRQASENNTKADDVVPDGFEAQEEDIPF